MVARILLSKIDSLDFCVQRWNIEAPARLIITSCSATFACHGPDFVGFDPRVDLEDVKLKVVNMVGQDMHDFNLWQSRDKQLARKPYLEGVEAEVTGQTQYSEAEMKARLSEVLGLENIQVISMPSGDGRDYVEVDLKDDRKRALKLYASNPEFHGMI